MEMRKVIGIVKAYARAIKEKKTDKGCIYKRGVMITYIEPLDGKIEGWHDIVAFGEKAASDSLMQLPDIFPKGSVVRFGEKQNGKFWNFMEGTFEIHDGPENKSQQKPVVEVQLKVEEETVRNPILKLDVNTSILRQVFLKVAVQAVVRNSESMKGVEMELTPKAIILFAQGLEEEWNRWEARK